MRIAQIAPLTESVPPKLYGGTERIVSFLTEELVAMGHEVTLFASGDSQTSAELAAMWPASLRLDPTIRDTNAPHMLMMERVFSPRRRVRCAAFPHGLLVLFAVRAAGHAVPDNAARAAGPAGAVAAVSQLSHVPVVSISNAQRRPLPHANYVSTVPHGLPERLLMPEPVEPGYLAFLGRISPEKRPDRAIQIARRAGLKLRIAAKVDKYDEAYFAEQIQPMLGGDVEFIGEINDSTKADFLSGAVGVLCPIDWPEPFGLVMIEALACGTPVIGFNLGSVPEVIEHGVTGFVVNDVDEAVAAVKRLPELSRSRVRAEFDRRFTARRMAEDYVQLYSAMAARSHPKLRVVT